MAGHFPIRTTLFIELTLLLLLSFSLLALLNLLQVSTYIIALTALFLIPLDIFLIASIQATHRNQTRNIAILLEALIDEDYSLRSVINSESDDILAIKQLLNKLSSRLSAQSLAIKEGQLLLEKVISHIDVAIIATTENYDITFTNPAACDLLDISNATANFNLAATSIPVSQVSTQPQSFTLQQGEISKTCRISMAKYFYNQKLNYLFFISDIQWLLIDKERDSWQRLHRVLSHEINNSLTPINSISATLLRQTEKSEPSIKSLQQGLTVIHNRSASLYSFISNFQKISKLPAPNKVLFCLTDLLGKCILLFPQATIEFVATAQIKVFADPQQLEQVFLNLIKNAIEAMPLATGTVSVSVLQSNKYISVIIEDEGTGISNSDNLFIPYFSTKENGSGIGLAFSRQILFNHLGDLQIKNRTDKKGAKAIVSLPKIGQD